jgi:NTE family protein
MNAVVPVSTRLPGIGLALSGGGYRATLFHLGTLRRLAELGVLERIDQISSVSGGSITAGVLAADWAKHPEGSILDRVARVTTLLRSFCSHTIDTGTIIGGALIPFRRISDLLAGKYDDGLFHGLMLADLAEAGPDFTFCATNLQTGRLVHLTRERIVDYKIGSTVVPVQLARAVAASSAFPPFLSPVEIDCSQALWKATTYSTLTNNPKFSKRLYLTDGGAYDNLGLEPIWDRYRNVLVSDAGAPYENAEDMHMDWITQLHAVFDIGTDQARGVRKRWLIDKYATPEVDGAYWGIETDIADYQLADALRVSPATIDTLAHMRTRLDAFSDEEQERLINWGYAVCDAAMRRWCRGLCTTPAAPAFPYPQRPMA